MERLAELWARVLRPGPGFAARARQAPNLRTAVGDLLLLRAPLAFLSLVLTYTGFARLYARIAAPDSDLWTFILQQVGKEVEPADLNAALAQLPPLPTLHALLPRFLLLAPLVILSLWLHDATMDHLALWLLGGLKTRRGFRASLLADAEALKVGVFGAAVALVSDVPGTGLVLTLLLAPVGVYFWLLRGWALAAWHDCPPWKGVAATVLHVVLLVVWVLLLILACLLMLVLVA